MSSRHAERLISAAEVCRELRPIGREPQNERQAREIASLPPEARQEAWAEALSAGATPEAIRSAVAKRKPAKVKTLKPIRLRLPGGTVIIEPNKRFTSAADILSAALANVRAREAA